MDRYCPRCNQLVPESEIKDNFHICRCRTVPAWSEAKRIEMRNSELQAENDKLKEGIELYIIFRNKEQFTPPEIMKRIYEWIGIEMKPGHLISSLRRDFEKALKED